MKKTNPICMFFICAVILTACATTPKAQTADKTFLSLPVRAKYKDVMILFTGSDWDESSQKAFLNLFTNEFLKTYSKDFDIYNADITRNPTENNEENLTVSYKYFSEYEIMAPPAVSLETSKGFVYEIIDITEAVNSPDKFEGIIQKAMVRREQVLTLYMKVTETTGPEHTKAIDAFLSSVKLPHSHQYDSLLAEALESDPENKTGLRNKYLLAITELKAVSYINQGNAKAAADEFLTIAEDDVFTVTEKQVNYYTAAYFLASNPNYNEQVLQYLNKALELDTHSELADQIRNAIKAVSKKLKNK